MGLTVYLPIAVVVFFAATTGADLVARTTIAGQPFAAALHEHLHWATVQYIGTMVLLTPFVAVAFACAFVEKHARARSALAIFGAAMFTLLHFYFEGHQAAELAAQQRMWTAATLDIGLLPFFVGGPVILAVVGAGALATKFDPRMPD